MRDRLLKTESVAQMLEMTPEMTRKILHRYEVKPALVIGGRGGYRWKLSSIQEFIRRLKSDEKLLYARRPDEEQLYNFLYNV